MLTRDPVKFKHKADILYIMTFCLTCLLQMPVHIICMYTLNMKHRQENVDSLKFGSVDQQMRNRGITIARIMSN